MAKVYFSKELDRILESIDFSRLGLNVAIKVHFGEIGCDTYISPDLVKAVYDKVVGMGKKATLIECNVLYRGSRTKRDDHLKTAETHGFTYAPIDILDGEMGEEEIVIDIKNSVVDKAHIGAGLKKYDSMIVLTHFKGHIAAGYGGAFKNVGMGLGSRSGKLHIHADVGPYVNSEKCVGCKICINNCNYDAINYVNNKAKIDSKKCVGCSMCIAVCPEGAIAVPWGSSTNEDLCKKIVDYSEAVIGMIGKEKMIYINFLMNITECCDCDSRAQKPIMSDIGILYSDDIVSVDKASLDLVRKKNEEFDNINDIDKDMQVEYAFEKSLGEKDYEMIDLD